MFRESANVYIKLYVYVPATVMTYCDYLSLSVLLCICHDFSNTAHTLSYVII